MIEASDFRNAMARLATAVSVITTEGESGAHGFTASAICSVSDNPPTLLVCMNQAARSHGHFVDHKTLCVNVLSARHEALSNTFASKLCSRERFEQGTWGTLVTGAPVLADALVSFDCEIEQVQAMGTHSIFMCRVVAIKHAEREGEADESLVYFNRAYHQVGQVESA